MALTYSKRLYLLLNKSSKTCALLAPKNKSQELVSVVYCSTNNLNVKNNKIVKAYLEKVEKNNEFLRQQLKEFELGKEFLASMMGRDAKEMTQNDIDEAIEYLFPSALFVKRARPLMKPPEEIFGLSKSAEFDETGRPYHYLYYTLKPNFSQSMHDAAETLEHLNKLLYFSKKPPKPLSLAGGKWYSQRELCNKFSEKLFDIEYEKFIEVLNKLGEHPLATEAEGFIKSFWKKDQKKLDSVIVPIVEVKEDVKMSTIEDARRKTSHARVTVSSPGTGKIRINNMGLDYFINMTSREQVIFPLLFSELIGKVDVEATVSGGGEASQSGAVRLGISRALEAFVSPEMFLEMKLAGLQEPDVRTRERKKPGREGARRSYTWLKR